MTTETLIAPVPERGIDELVAAYAPLGRTRRDARRRGKTRSGLLAAAALLVAGGVISQLTPDRITGWAQQVAAYLKVEPAGQRDEATTAPARDALAAEAAETRQQREALARQRELLAADLANLDAQQAELAARRAEFESQQSALSAAVGELERKRDEMLSGRARLDDELPELEAAIARINQQRAELDRQRRGFQQQRAMLASEIELMADQRADLERQRSGLEQQWTELRLLMERINEVSTQRQAPADPPVPTESRVGNEPPETLPIDPEIDLVGANETVASVDDGVLGDTRGGISLGGDLDIAIGLTRSASINGVEQFSSSVSVDGLDSASLAALGDVSTVLIQNGAGNSVNPAALEALSGGFATIIQNTLDGQQIEAMNVFDIAIGNVESVSRGINAADVVADSLAFQQ